MSNSFNISFKPEIAAAVVKIDAIKTVIDDIHNTDLLNVTNIVTTSYAAVLDIHDTDLPAAVVKIDANKAVIDNIHDTDLPAVKTVVDSNGTKIDTIDGVCDAIKLKTDIIPQKVRGDFSIFYLATTSSSFVDVLNITGQGKLLYCLIEVLDAADTFEIKIIVDAIACTALSHTGDTNKQVIIYADVTSAGDTINLGKVAIASIPGYLLNIEFSTSLQIQIRRSAGTANQILCKAAVNVDSF